MAFIIEIQARAIEVLKKPVRRDIAITSLTTEHIIGLTVRRSENFDERLPRILDATLPATQ